MFRNTWTKRATLLVALSLLCFVLPTSEAAKKKKGKGSKGSKSVKQAASDPLKCGVCMAVVDEIQKELQTTENSTSTLDLRWGLTAEVTEGRAKRIGKVIPYKRSELRSIEVMEKVCETMKSYARYERVKGEVQLMKTPNVTALEAEYPDNQRIKRDSEESQKDRSKFERFCEELIEKSEERIVQSVRNGDNTTAMVDAVCYGEESVCGKERTKCQPGSYSDYFGLAPCSLCLHGTYQTEEGQTSCVSCADGFNTSLRGSASDGNCTAICKPGTFSENGLEPCSPCGMGAYQPEAGSRQCNACPDGKNTEATGAMYVTECVSKCGDGRKSTEEECDDGNVYPGDGCDHECKVEPGSACSFLSSVGSKSECNKVICGDGKRQNSTDGTVTEACDDGNVAEKDGCSSSCQLEEGFVCDLSKDKSDCHEVKCGDGVQELSTDGARDEKCDDGNEKDGDGCNSSCKMEEGFICSGRYGQRTLCYPVTCGDGLRESSGSKQEACDDGNTEDGDGCSSSCSIEAGFQCEPMEGSRRGRSYAMGVEGFLTQGKDNCTRIPGSSNETGGEEKKEGGFFSNLFGGKKAAEPQASEL